MYFLFLIKFRVKKKKKEADLHIAKIFFLASGRKFGILANCSAYGVGAGVEGWGLCSHQQLVLVAIVALKQLAWSMLTAVMLRWFFTE